MMKLNLPKKYFSYSQMNLWIRNKDQYRERYYLNGPSFENKETIFGKKVAKMLEDGVKDPVLDKVPRHKTMECRMELNVGGVPFLGVIDSFNIASQSIIEYKTGKELWDTVRVHKHDQLVVYSLLAKLKYKTVDPIVKLVWIETRYAPIMDKIGSRTIERDSDDLEFTGKVEVFERKIVEWERKDIKDKIIKNAMEISEDFTNFKKNI